MSRLRVAIVTVNHNGAADTLELLASLGRLDVSKYETKIVVVDNGSTDASVAQIAGKYPHLSLLQTGVNLGYAGGYNRAFTAALAWQADYIMAINNDTSIPDKHFLHRLMSTITSAGDIGVVCPKVLFAPGYEFHQDRYGSKDIGRVIWYAGGRFDWDNVVSVHRGINEVDRGQYAAVASVDFANGCCLLVKREVVDRVGFFDPGLFAYFEDNDLSLRIRRAGYRIVYDGGTRIYHKVSRTAGIGSEFTDYLLTRNRLAFGLHHAPWRSRIALLRQAVGFVVGGRPAQRLGVVDFFKGVTGYPYGTTSYHRHTFSPPKISVVTVNWNVNDLLHDCLKSVLATDYPNLEVIVVDNASRRRFLPPSDPRVVFVRNKINVGLPRAWNQGLKLAGGDYLLILNPDTQLPVDFFVRMVETAKSIIDVGVIGPKFVDPNGRPQGSVFPEPSVINYIRQYWLGRFGLVDKFTPTSPLPVEVNCVSGACLFFPRSTYERIGPFTERTFMYYEDLDYCRRIRRAGLKVVFNPKTTIIHGHGRSTRQTGGAAHRYLWDASLWYNGTFKHYLLWFVTWSAQKLKAVGVKLGRRL